MIKYLFVLFPITVFSQEYETQKYDLLKTIDNIEIRYYPPSMRAKVSSNRNFSKLFQYISGNNENSEKIAMTTPVYMTQEKGKSTMEFVLPSKYSEGNAVLPKDKDILVYSSKPGYYAAIRFGGYSNIQKVNLNHKILLEKIKQNNLSIVSENPIALSYNSPYKVFNRRNEVLVEIDYSPK
jgi:hypothetical protein